MTVTFLFESLPAVDVRLPLLIFAQMPAKNVYGTRRRFLWNAHQLHVRLLHPAAALTVIAMGAGCHNVRPDMLAPHMAGCDVIHRQAALALAAILAGIIITAKDLAACQLDVGARPMNLNLQPDDGRTRQQLFHRPNVSTPIHDHIGFARQEQANRPPRGTDIDRLEIRVEH